MQIEKTVEINENCQFMEDLEMLRTAPPEDLPSFVDHETSPEHSENGLGSFKLKGSNPLEQLGLYMKVDDEEEEEIEPQSVAGAVHDDVEEGEIWLTQYICQCSEYNHWSTNGKFWSTISLSSFWKELDSCGLFIKDGFSLLDWRGEVRGKILMQAIEALPFSVPLDD